MKYTPDNRTTKRSVSAAVVQIDSAVRQARRVRLSFLKSHGMLAEIVFAMLQTRVELLRPTFDLPTLAEDRFGMGRILTDDDALLTSRIGQLLLQTANMLITLGETASAKRKMTSQAPSVRIPSRMESGLCEGERTFIVRLKRTAAEFAAATPEFHSRHWRLMTVVFVLDGIRDKLTEGVQDLRRQIPRIAFAKDELIADQKMCESAIGRNFSRLIEQAESLARRRSRCE